MNLPDHMKDVRQELGDRTSDFFFLFHALNRGYHCRINQISQEIGLSKGQPPVLLFLEKETSRTQRELADFLNVKPASMTDVLQRMEKNGLVVRERDENDARLKKIKLTKKALDIHERHEKHIDSFEQFLRNGITEEELNSFFAIADKMIIICLSHSSIDDVTKKFFAQIS